MRVDELPVISDNTHLNRILPDNPYATRESISLNSVRIRNSVPLAVVKSYRMTSVSVRRYLRYGDKDNGIAFISISSSVQSYSSSSVRLINTKAKIRQRVTGFE